MHFNNLLAATWVLFTLPCLHAKVVQFEFERREKPLSASGGSLRRRDDLNAPIYNAQGDLLYLVNITAGNPPQPIQLQLDTGSSDVWLPYANSQVCSKTSQNRCSEGSYDPSASLTSKLVGQNLFTISYVDGTKITGDYISDDFGIGGHLIKGMTMGLARAASEPTALNDFTGIAGIGFEQGESIYYATGRTYPNMLSMLKSSGIINARAFSLWLNDKDHGVGSVLFGGVDTAKYKGDLVALPIQPDARSNSIISFTVVLDGLFVTDATDKIAYERKNASIPVILDSGTTITYLPDAIAQDLQVGVGAVISNSYGAVVPCSLAKSTATISFRFGNANGPVIVAPIAQFVLDFPVNYPAPRFKTNNELACRWGIQGSAGRPNLFGDTFLRGAYVVYNLDKSEVAIANAVVNTTESNIQEFAPNNNDIPGVSNTAKGVAVSFTATTGLTPNTIVFASGATLTASPTGSLFNLGAVGTKSTAGSSATGGPGDKTNAADGLYGARYPEMAVLFSGLTAICVLFGASFVLSI